MAREQHRGARAPADRAPAIGGERAARRRRRWTSLTCALLVVAVAGASCAVPGGDDGTLHKAEPARRRSGTPPTMADHWHSAYGIYVCDEFLDPLADQVPDATGLHTHEDGLVHIHPFTPAVTSRRATWSTFGQTVGLELGAGSVTILGTELAEGLDCGGQPATIALYEWSADDLTQPPTIHTDDLGSVRFAEDHQVFTLAIVPEGSNVPMPPSVGDLLRRMGR